MRSEFKRVTVDRAVELIIDHRGRTPKKLGGDFTGHGVQVISAKNVYGSRLHADESQRFVPPELARRWMPNALNPGDVLLTSEAPLGEAAYLNGEGNFCLGQRLFGLRARPGVAHGRFLYYALVSPVVQARLHARASGTTAQGIKQSELRQVELDLPPLGEQERIASVLGALDDKIDSNRRLANVVEATVASMFRYEFVDRGYGTTAEDRPGDRRMGTLSTLADIRKNSVQPSATPEATFEHFSIPAFDTDGDPEEALGATILSGKIRIPDRDVVLLSKLNPRMKRVWWPRPSGVGTPVCSPEFLVLESRAGIPASYLYSVVSFDERFYGELLSHVTGTTGSRQRVKPRDAMGCAALVPSAEDLRAWDAFARPLLDLRHRTRAENRMLARVRDALLPRLVSGAIRVPETSDDEDATGVAAEEVAA